MAPEYTPRWNVVFGRTILAALCIYIGYSLYMDGNEFYNPYFHAFRKALLGKNAKNRITNDLTYDEVNYQFVRCLGALFVVGGALTGIGQ